MQMEKDAKKSKQQRKGIIKFDADTAKLLPISTDRKRKEGFIETREGNDLSITIKAPESLNYYDLITLFQALDDYSKNNDKWEFQGKMQIDKETERILKKRTFDLEELCIQRGISVHKNNRKSIANSFERWFNAKLIYRYEDEDKPISTRYIYEYEVNEKKYDKLTIIANANFLDLCLQDGMAMNWERLIKYQKNYYAIALDIHLQFRAIAYGKKTKKYKYPDIIKEETLFKATGIDNDVKEIREKRRKLKQAFKKFEEVTGQKYIYDKLERKWIKESYLKFVKEKNKNV